MKKLIIIVLIFYSSGIFGQDLNIEDYQCVTFVYNLSSDKMRIRDICFSIVNTDHIDMNQYSIGAYDKTKDFWKFQIEIVDNQKHTKNDLNASFYIYEDSAKLTQYHCIAEYAEIKAIIFDKLKKKWQILVYQYGDYKILSPYSGYTFVNAFGI